MEGWQLRFEMCSRHRPTLTDNAMDLRQVSTETVHQSQQLLGPLHVLQVVALHQRDGYNNSNNTHNYSCTVFLIHNERSRSKFFENLTVDPTA